MTEDNAYYYAKRLKEADDLVHQWLGNPALKFNMLTEDQWLQTVSYFRGCAICDDEHVEARTFLLPFQKGGRYAPWNMLPMCGKCARYSRRMSNPFTWLRNSYVAKTLGLTTERRKMIEEYFIQKVREQLEQQDSGI